MDRKYNYYRQKVTDSEFRTVFDLAEDADRNFAADQQLVGVGAGWDVTPRSPASILVDVAAGVGYDKLGRRLASTGSTAVNLTQDVDGILTAVGPGNERICAIFARFDRLLQDPRTDGNGNAIYYDQPEIVDFVVVAGAEAVAGMAVAPALDDEDVLVADITINDTGVVTLAQISDGRREWAVKVVGTNFAIEVGTPVEAFESVVTQLESTTGELLVGADAKTSGSLTLSAGTLADQLDQILSYVSQGAHDVYTVRLMLSGRLDTGTLPTYTNRDASANFGGSAGGVTIPLSFLRPGDRLLTLEAVVVKDNAGTTLRAEVGVSGTSKLSVETAAVVATTLNSAESSYTMVTTDTAYARISLSAGGGTDNQIQRLTLTYDHPPV